jgi:hypothetical protein
MKKSFYQSSGKEDRQSKRPSSNFSHLTAHRSDSSINPPDKLQNSLYSSRSFQDRTQQLQHQKPVRSTKNLSIQKLEQPDIKVLDCVEFFSLPETTIFSLCTNSEERKSKAFYGETILRSVITAIIDSPPENSTKKNHEGLILLREKYHSTIILSAFLLEGTNFPLLFPQFKEQTSYWSASMVHALLLESCPKERRNLLNLHLWTGKIHIVKDWIDQNIDFKNNFPELDQREQTIYWKNCQTNHILWKYHVDYDNNNNEIEILEDIQLVKLIKDVLLKRPPINLTIPISSSSSSGEDNKMESMTTSESKISKQLSLSLSPPSTLPLSTLPVKVAIAPVAMAKLPVVEDEELYRTPRAASHSPSTTNKIIYRNLLDFQPSMMTQMLQESKAYTEKYGNTMNYLPATQEDGHEWNELRLRHSTLYGEHSRYTWCGSQCIGCGCFLIRRKVTNKNSNLFILGLKQCPKSLVDNWVLEYQRLLKEKVSLSGDNLVGKFVKDEFMSWGFLPASPVTTPPPIPNDHSTSTINLLDNNDQMGIETISSQLSSSSSPTKLIDQNGPNVKLSSSSITPTARARPRDDLGGSKQL